MCKNTKEKQDFSMDNSSFNDHFGHVCNECYFGKYEERIDFDSGSMSAGYTKLPIKHLWNNKEKLMQIYKQNDGGSAVEEKFTYEDASKLKEGLEKSFQENITRINQELAGQESSTGSLRYNKGKAGVHQVPPDVVLDIAKVLDYGASKYSEFNWAKGNNLSVPYACAMRHLLAFWNGEDNDKESGLSHLAHVMTNIMMMSFYKKNFTQFDDRFFKKDE